MVVLLLVLRLVHIVAGALWAGAAIFYFFFVEPTVQGLGPARPKFMQDLVTKRRYPVFMNVTSGLTILAGLLLFWFASGGLQLSWITSGPGLGFTVGSLAALGAYGVGFFGIRPRVERMNALGQAIAAAGGPPSAEQAAELQRLEAEMHRVERWDVILLSASLVAMATARYWTF